MRLNSKFLQKYGILLLFSVVFWIFYFGALFQGWIAFSLLLIPLIQYLFFAWLQIVRILKTPYIFNQYQMQSHSLGNINKISRNFFYCSIAEISLIIIMGIESHYHPQLVNVYFVLYIVLIVLLCVFSTFFSMSTLTTDSKVVIIAENQESIIIPLSTKHRKQIFYISIITIAALSILWIATSVLGYFDIFSFMISVPGSTEQLLISYFLIPTLILAFLHPICLICSVHIYILLETISYVKNNMVNAKLVFLNMIKNYVLLPRFFRAWL